MPIKKSPTLYKKVLASKQGEPAKHKYVKASPRSDSVLYKRKAVKVDGKTKIKYVKVHKLVKAIKDAVKDKKIKLVKPKVVKPLNAKAVKSKADKPLKAKADKSKAVKPLKAKLVKVKAVKPLKAKLVKVKAVKPLKAKLVKVKAVKPLKAKLVKAKLVKAKVVKPKAINLSPLSSPIMARPVGSMLARKHLGSMYRSPSSIPRFNASPVHPVFGHLRSTCNDFWKNRKVNPLTKRSIKFNGPVYKKLDKECNKYFNQLPLTRVSGSPYSSFGSM